MRDNFLKSTSDALAKRVGVRCSNPGCRKPTIGPRSSDAVRIVCIGVAAHVTAAAKGGPRYNAELSPEERRSAENGIWLCQNCAKLVDNDVERYTVSVLREWKREAEAEALAALEGKGASPVDALPEDAAELEFAIGGRVMASGRLPRVSKYGEDAGGCNRHDYDLTVSVRNLGNERLNGYHVDLEFPRDVLEHPEQHENYVAGRSTSTTAFFRASGDRAPELFPGDEAIVIALAYFVDEEVFWGVHQRSRANVFEATVRATLHRPRLAPLRLSGPFDDFQNY